MVFIYWGWDTAVAVNEETKDQNKTPGRAAILSTFILLVTYALVILSMQSFAGIKTTGNGLGNIANAGDVLSVQGKLVFGTSGLGLVPLPPAAADGAVLGRGLHPDHDPAHRPDHAVHGRVQGDPASRSRRSTRKLPDARRCPRSSWALISIVVYVVFNYASNGIGVIGDAVIAIGLYIAFYYGLTGFACAWYYRRNLPAAPATCGCRASCRWPAA